MKPRDKDGSIPVGDEQLAGCGYQPKTGARCSCKRGVQRDNCPTCEGTGMVINFAAIRARRTT